MLPLRLSVQRRQPHSNSKVRGDDHSRGACARHSPPVAGGANRERADTRSLPSDAGDGLCGAGRISTLYGTARRCSRLGPARRIFRLPSYRPRPEFFSPTAMAANACMNRRREMAGLEPNFNFGGGAIPLTLRRFKYLFRKPRLSRCRRNNLRYLCRAHGSDLDTLYGRKNNISF